MGITPNDAIGVSKFAIAINHVKNNRIEYLVLMLLAHMIGLTSKAAEHASGMC
jgi:hypothetical protein